MIKLVFVLIAFCFIASCKSSKDERFVVIHNEMKLIKNNLIGVDIENNSSVIRVIENSSQDGQIRWKIINSENYILRSIEKYPTVAGGRDEYFIYLDKNIQFQLM